MPRPLCGWAPGTDVAIKKFVIFEYLVEMADGKIKHGSNIGIKSLELAIRWSLYLESHARRVYSMATDH